MSRADEFTPEERERRKREILAARDHYDALMEQWVRDHTEPGGTPAWSASSDLVATLHESERDSALRRWGFREGVSETVRWGGIYQRAGRDTETIFNLLDEWALGKVARWAARGSMHLPPPPDSPEQLQRLHALEERSQELLSPEEEERWRRAWLQLNRERGLDEADTIDE